MQWIWMATEYKIVVLLDTGGTGPCMGPWDHASVSGNTTTMFQPGTRHCDEWLTMFGILLFVGNP